AEGTFRESDPRCGRARRGGFPPCAPYLSRCFCRGFGWRASRGFLLAAGGLCVGLEVGGRQRAVLLLHEDLDLLLRLLEDLVAGPERGDARLVLLQRFLEAELAGFEGSDDLLDRFEGFLELGLRLLGRHGRDSIEEPADAQSLGPKSKSSSMSFGPEPNRTRSNPWAVMMPPIRAAKKVARPMRPLNSMSS